MGLATRAIELPTVTGGKNDRDALAPLVYVNVPVVSMAPQLNRTVGSIQPPDLAVHKIQRLAYNWI